METSKILRIGIQYRDGRVDKIEMVCWCIMMPYNDEISADHYAFDNTSPILLPNSLMIVWLCGN